MNTKDYSLFDRGGATRIPPPSLLSLSFFTLRSIGNGGSKRGRSSGRNRPGSAGFGLSISSISFGSGRVTAGGLGGFRAGIELLVSGFAGGVGGG